MQINDYFIRDHTELPIQGKDIGYFFTLKGYFSVLAASIPN
jgi:hypothetical protein